MLIQLKKWSALPKKLVSSLPSRRRTSPPLTTLKFFLQAQRRASPSSVGREQRWCSRVQTLPSPPLHHRICETRVDPLLIARTCRRLCWTSTFPPVRARRFCLTTPCLRELLIFFGNLKCISLHCHQLSSPRVPPLHQSVAAFRPWPLPPPPNVSEFALLLG